jgi:hypothetical protein
MPTNQPKLDCYRLLAAKAETTTGTAIATTGTDAQLIIIDPKLTPDNPFSERPNQGAGGQLASTPNQQTGKLTFDVEVYGSGTGGSSPQWASSLLPPCNYTESSGTFTYTNNASTVTLSMFEDGKKRTLYGAKGTVKFAKDQAAPGRASFEFTGKFVEQTDTSILSPTLPTNIAPITGTVTFTSGTASYTPTLSKIEYDVGNNVVLREDLSATDGYRGAAIVNWKPTYTLDPETEAQSTRDWKALQLAATAEALSFTIGSTTGNRMVIAASAAQTIKVERGSRNGILVENVTGQVNGAAPATITFS